MKILGWCSRSRSFSSENIGLVFRVNLFCFFNTFLHVHCSSLLLLAALCCSYSSYKLQLPAPPPPPQMDRSQSMNADCKIPDHSISVWINQICCMIFSPLCFHLISSCVHQCGTMKHRVMFFLPSGNRIICVIICFKQRNPQNGGENHQTPAVK